jgi:hypothetical protein
MSFLFGIGAFKIGKNQKKSFFIFRNELKAQILAIVVSCSLYGQVSNSFADGVVHFQGN